MRPAWIKTKGFIVFVSFYLGLLSKHIADAQNNVTFTTESPYAQLAVVDQDPTLPSSAEKIYTTSLLLQKNLQNVVFVDSTFQIAAAGLYTQLQGYNGLRNILPTDQGTTVAVIYDAVYVYATLNASSTDDDVTNTIGNLNAVIAGFQQNAMFNALFTIDPDPSTFTFTGNSLCPIAQCTQGAYMACTEVLDGVTIKCVSPCKNGYCYNGATCNQVTYTSAPVCDCPVQTNVWYSGSQCQTKVTLWMILLIVIVPLLVILAIILVWCLIVYKRKRSKIEQLKQEEELAQVNRAFAIENGNIVEHSVQEEEKVNNEREKRRMEQKQRSRRESTTTVDESSSEEESSEEESSESEETSSSEEESSEDDESIRVGVDSLDSYTLKTGVAPIQWFPSKTHQEYHPPKIPEPIKPAAKPKKLVKKPEPKKPDIGLRAGWQPSLGPMMFDIKKSTENLADLTDENETLSNTQYSITGETDL